MPIAAFLLALASSEPMLDGNCSDHRPAAEAKVIAPGVELFVRQTRDHVWLCYTAPADSYATADLVIEAPGLAGPLNLHASAQLGEWSATEAAAAPKVPSDPRWWKVSGWTATTNRLTGVATAGSGERHRLLHAPAREFQLSKARFGRGEWRLSLIIANVRRPDGSNAEVRWPESGRFTVKAD